MPSRKNLLEALRALRDHEEAAQHGWEGGPVVWAVRLMWGLA
ncbi:hypothetical protein [Streptomyces sp. NPDC001851]